ncbi:hypothetical protein VP01_191g7 [Puccinia sorghi]|uniref:Uncharacterized protein n=1 Tax=Puccinia sorghi TaxID=27349 RepID=A0A0L6VCM1_9BASI|nr:hypothetical protein VP01_191g7 [Puccinia sorghi]
MGGWLTGGCSWVYKMVTEEEAKESKQNVINLENSPKRWLVIQTVMISIGKKKEEKETFKDNYSPPQTITRGIRRKMIRYVCISNQIGVREVSVEVLILLIDMLSLKRIIRRANIENSKKGLALYLLFSSFLIFFFLSGEPTPSRFVLQQPIQDDLIRNHQPLRHHAGPKGYKFQQNLFIFNLRISQCVVAQTILIRDFNKKCVSLVEWILILSLEWRWSCSILSFKFSFSLESHLANSILHFTSMFFNFFYPCILHELHRFSNLINKLNHFQIEIHPSLKAKISEISLSFNSNPPLLPISCTSLSCWYYDLETQMRGGEKVAKKDLGSVFWKGSMEHKVNIMDKITKKQSIKFKELMERTPVDSSGHKNILLLILRGASVKFLTDDQSRVK